MNRNSNTPQAKLSLLLEYAVANPFSQSRLLSRLKAGHVTTLEIENLYRYHETNIIGWYDNYRNAAWRGEQ